MNAIEFGVLQACQEVVSRQRELGPLLADTLDIPESQLLYAWILGKPKKSDQHGAVKGTDWNYFFHGFECDLRNKTDRRFLRIDFGPRGRLDTVTAWGVLQFIMASTFPWPEFAELKTHFAKSDPPFTASSGDLHKMAAIWDGLESKGALQKADQSLVNFMQQYTVKGADGIPLVQFPPGTSDEMSIDCFVAQRECLSLYGQQVLEKSAATV